MILATEEMITVTLKMIKGIFTTEEVITITLNVVSATTKVI